MKQARKDWKEIRSKYSMPDIPPPKKTVKKKAKKATKEEKLLQQALLAGTTNIDNPATTPVQRELTMITTSIEIMLAEAPPTTETPGPSFSEDSGTPYYFWQK